MRSTDRIKEPEGNPATPEVEVGEVTLARLTSTSSKSRRKTKKRRRTRNRKSKSTNRKSKRSKKGIVPGRGKKPRGSIQVILHRRSRKTDISKRH